MNDLLNQLHNQVLVDYIQDDTQPAEVIPAEVEESATALAKQQAMQELVEKRKKEKEEWALRRGIQKGVPDQEGLRLPVPDRHRDRGGPARVLLRGKRPHEPPGGHLQGLRD